MNQEKVGEFISRLRKSKNLTQCKLAEKLGISDKAISKWENGKSMPDMSLLQLLSENLDVTVDELLSGEYIEKEHYEIKADENIIEALKFVGKMRKQKNVFGGGGLVLLGLLTNNIGMNLDNNVSDFSKFMSGLSHGLSAGMMIVGVVIVVYSIAKYQKKNEHNMKLS